MNHQTRLMVAFTLLPLLGAGLTGCPKPLSPSSPIPLAPTVTPIPTLSSFTLTATPSQTPTGTVTPTFPATLTSTPTSTVTQTPTFTVSATPSKTPTPSSSCTSTATFGDSTFSTSVIVVNTNTTYAQGYNLSANAAVQEIWIDPAAPMVVKVGLYDDLGSLTYPNNLLYQSAAVTLVGGPASIPVPGVALTAGNYWLAYEVLSGTPDFYSASGSTASNDRLPSDFPSPWFVCHTGIPYPTVTPTCTLPPRGFTNEVMLYAGYCY